MQPNQLVAQLSADDRRLVRLIEHGIPISARPYAEIAEQLAITEQQVVARIQALIHSGAIKRYGVVVRHHELGYKANGMVVWNIPDEIVSETGRCIGQYDCVTLSYRRPRCLPDWPYNLFTMVHGQNREEVIEQVNRIVQQCHLQNFDHAILFSTRRFKQRGAQYSSAKHAATQTEQPLSAKLKPVRPQVRA
jgi:DNA-binding Lrp family transcriptional regulator